MRPNRLLTRYALSNARVERHSRAQMRCHSICISPYRLAVNRTLRPTYRKQYIGTPVVLMGGSIGGALAIDFAVEHPDAVSKLVLVDPQVRFIPNTRVLPTPGLSKDCTGEVGSRRGRLRERTLPGPSRRLLPSVCFPANKKLSRQAPTAHTTQHTRVCIP